MREIEKKISILIEQAKAFGLGEVDLTNAREALDYFEYEVAFDTIVTQLYEYGIKINIQFIRLSEDICDSMGIARTRYAFLVELLETDLRPGL